MTKLQFLNVFLTERLMLAAQEIYKQVEETILEYQEEIIQGKRENDQLRRKFGIPWPDREPFAPVESEEEGGIGQKREPEPRQTMEKQEGRTRKEENQFRGPDSQSRFTPSNGNDDYDQNPPQHTSLSQFQTHTGESREGGSLSSSSTSKPIKTETEGLGVCPFDPSSDPNTFSSSVNLELSAAQSENSDYENTDDFWCCAVWREGQEEVEGVVPSTWVVGRKVLWPPANGRKALKERHKPGANWTTYDLVKVKLFSESLEECEGYSRSSDELTDNGDSEPNTQKKKRRRRKRRTGEGHVTGPDQIPQGGPSGDGRIHTGVSGSSNSPPLKRRVMTKSGTLEESSGALEAEPQLDPSELRGLDDALNKESYLIEGPHSSDAWDAVFPTSQSREGTFLSGQDMMGNLLNSTQSFPLPNDQFQEQVLGLLVDIRQSVWDLGGRVGVLEHWGGSRGSGTDFHFDVCRTYEDMANLEKVLEPPEVAAQMKQFLSRIGGNTLRENVTRVMERLMTNELMSTFNMKGRKGTKKSFLTHSLSKIIIDSIMITHPYATESAVMHLMANVLKYAPDRRGGGGRPPRQSPQVPHTQRQQHIQQHINIKQEQDY
ncbi:uncharacterized protein LOC129851469 isoform X3 [Salvelinus fontinalis]|uniref:uncharacterized protein LOC129851469 isoform X3 n=1 Tax=Salvelinus fontinalis TaxID=8038 RepID=UPI002485B5E0|nr:uncharacterized protein LOC129851469 isoform X3 [Salvelinus fontinalis]